LISPLFTTSRVPSLLSITTGTISSPSGESGGVGLYPPPTQTNLIHSVLGLQSCSP